MKITKLSQISVFLFLALTVGVFFQNCAENNAFDSSTVPINRSSSSVDALESSLSIDKEAFPFSAEANFNNVPIGGVVEIEIFNVTNGTDPLTDLYVCVWPPTHPTNPCIHSSTFILMTPETNPAYQFDNKNNSFLYKQSYSREGHEPGKYTFHFRRGLNSNEIFPLSISLTSSSQSTDPSMGKCTIQVANGGSDFSPSLVGQACVNNEDPYIRNSKGWYICKCR